MDLSGTMEDKLDCQNRLMAKIIIDLELNDPSVDFVPSIEEDIRSNLSLYCSQRTFF